MLLALAVPRLPLLWRFTIAVSLSLIRTCGSMPRTPPRRYLPGCSVDGVADASLSPYLRDQVLRDAVEL